MPNSTIVPLTVDKTLFQIGRGRAHYNYNKGALRIVHAPSRPFIKGTQFLLDAVEKLQHDGYRVEVDLLTGISNSQVIERCISADLCVDQLRIGWYGVFSVEAMALGLPVVCYIRDDLLHYLPEDRPIINASPVTIYNVIKSILDDRSLLNNYAHNAYKYAMRTHHPDVVSGILEYIYSDDWEPKKNETQIIFIQQQLNWLSFEKHKNKLMNLFRLDEIKPPSLLMALQKEKDADYFSSIKLYELVAAISGRQSVRYKYLLSRISYLRRKHGL